LRAKRFATKFASAASRYGPKTKKSRRPVIVDGSESQKCAKAGAYARGGRADEFEVPADVKTDALRNPIENPAADVNVDRPAAAAAATDEPRSPAKIDCFALRSVGPMTTMCRFRAYVPATTCRRDKSLDFYKTLQANSVWPSE